MFTPTRVENADSLVEDVNRIQDDLVTEFARILPFTFEGPTLVKAVVLSINDTDVPHGLGRLPRGYIISKLNVSAIVFDGDESATSPKKFISLQATTAVTVDIIFF